MQAARKADKFVKGNKKLMKFLLTIDSNRMKFECTVRCFVYLLRLPVKLFNLSKRCFAQNDSATVDFFSMSISMTRPEYFE